MNVYVAIETGVYRHRIVGVFATAAAACAAGKAAIEAESDHYHTIDVVRIEVDGEPFAETDVGFWRWRRTVGLVGPEWVADE